MRTYTVSVCNYVKKEINRFGFDAFEFGCPQKKYIVPTHSSKFAIILYTANTVNNSLLLYISSMT
jgi:hypothetical protein